MNEQVSYFKRALVLLMAVIMVFTYMPNGTWGGAQTAWADENPTVITTSSDFANMDADGNYKLGEDITVDSPYANKFTGTFDGDGHTVTLNLNVTSGNAGLFGEIGYGASIKNVIVEADVTSSVASSSCGTGGLVGKISGASTIENCGVSGSVKSLATGTYSCAYVGGLVGNMSGSATINDSYTTCDVSSTGESSSSSTGGLVGRTSNYNTLNVTNCYASGSVTAKKGYAGGIAGYIYCSASYKQNYTNCYSAGEVKVTGVTTENAYGFAYSYATTGFSFNNCYYNSTLNTNGGFNKTADGIKGKDTDALKSLADTLGDAYRADATPNLNNGYPILSWQYIDPNAKCTVTFKVTPANSILTWNGKQQEVSKDGTYTFSEVAVGNHTYSVTNEAGDYTAQSGTISAKGKNITQNVNLQLNKHNLTFTLTPSDADFKLKSGDTELTPTSSGSKTYSVVNGTYSYEASAFGYKTKTGEVKVDRDDKSETVTLEEQPKVTVTFAYDDSKSDVSNGKIEVTTGSKTMTAKEGSNGMVYELPAGYSYGYKFTSANYARQTGTIDLTNTAEAGSESITPSMVEKTAWEGADDITVPSTDADGVYQISSGSELAWLAQQINSGKYNTCTAVLTKDIDLGGKDNWTPIGKSYSYAFKGTFDGQGHTVRGLKIEGSTSANYGLFGYMDGGTIKNLTVSGQIDVTGSGSSSYGVAGILGTLSGTSGIIENCVNEVVVNGSQNVGGIAGYVSGGYSTATKQIKNCVNIGKITSVSNNSAGIAGYVYGQVTIDSCYNRGDISSGSYRAGGITAYLSSTNAKIQNCYTTGATSVTNGSDSTVVVGKKNSGTITNCFFLDTAGTDSNATSKTSDELKGLAGTLGGDFITASASQNDGYPILKFQDKTPKYSVSIKVTNENATLKVFDEEGSEVTPTSSESGTYTFSLKAGKYTYSAELFGYKTETKEFSVSADAAEPIEITLQEVAKYQVGFSILPATAVNPTIKVLYNGEVVAPTGAGTYSLPEGTYTWIVKARGYAKQTGTLEVKNAETISVTLQTSTAWDGDEKEPVTPNAEGTYEISTGAELAWFAEQVNSGTGARYNAILTDDIDLGSYAFNPIGSNSKKYSGKFDGQGFSIKNLNIESDETYTALFGYVSDAEISNLIITGSVTGSGNYAGGIVGYADKAKVTNCGNEASVTSTSTNTWATVAGIVATMNYSNASTIEGCYNAGTITSAGYAAGICADITSGASIKNCYNAGNVSGAYAAGIGRNTIEITFANCYNIGKIKGTSGTYAISGSSSSEYDTAYYLDGSVANAISQNGTKKTATELRAKSFITTLGDAWKADTTGATNNWYPVLAWQSLVTPSEVTKLDTPENLTWEYIWYGKDPATASTSEVAGTSLITGEGDEEGDSEGEGSEDESLIGSLVGDHPGYSYDFTGKASWDAVPGAASYTLKLYHWDDNPNDVEATFTGITDTEFDFEENYFSKINASVEGAEGIYFFTVTAVQDAEDSWHTKSEESEWDDSGYGYEGSVLPAKPTGSIGWSTYLANAVWDHSVKDADAYSIELYKGEYKNAKIVYTDTAEGMTEATDTITFNFNDMLKKLGGGNYFYVLRAQKVVDDSNSPYFGNTVSGKMAVSEVLNYTGQGSDVETRTVTIKSAAEWIEIANIDANSFKDKGQSFKTDTDAQYYAWQKTNYELGCDIDFSNLTAEQQAKTKSIGNKTVNFTGTFDGNGHKITGLTLSNSDAGLFAWIGEGAVVKDITIENPNVQFSDNAAVLCWNNYGTITNCAVINANITADTGAIIGGMVSRNYGTIEKSYVLGGKMTTRSTTANGHGGFVGGNYGTIRQCYTTMEIDSQSYNEGGFAGWADNGGSFTDCFALGNVSAKNGWSGGFVGRVNDSTCRFTNCYAANKVTSSSKPEHCYGFFGSFGSEGMADVTGGTGAFEITPNSDNIKNCFYASDLTTGDNAKANEMSTAKTLSDMKTEAFKNTLGDNWSIDASKNDGLPYLTAVKAPTTLSTTDITVKLLVATYDNDKYAFEKDGDVIDVTIASTGNTRVIDVLEAAQKQNKITYTYTVTPAYGSFVESINGHKLASPNGWMFTVNDDLSNVSASLATVEDGDKVLWYQGTTQNLFKAPTWESLTGEQTAETATIITTAQQLVDLSNGDATALSGNYKLGANIDLSGIDFKGIGGETPFSGTFDGNGYTISNMTITKTAETSCAGLFNIIKGATIKNVKLENASVTAGQAVGLLVGYAQAEVSSSGMEASVANLIGNCQVSGTVKSLKTSTGGDNPYAWAGGLIGFNGGETDAKTGISSYCSVDNCSADVTVEASLPYAGGLVGRNFGYITDSEATGSVSGKIGVGGFVGCNDGAIYDSHSEGNATGESSVGGFAGVTYGTIESCYSLGDAKLTGNGGGNAGGFVGTASGTIKNSMNAGTVRDLGTNNSPIGGFAGHYEGTIVGLAKDIQLSGNYGNCIPESGDSETPIKAIGNKAKGVTDSEDAALKAMQLATNKEVREKLFEMFGVWLDGADESEIVDVLANIDKAIIAGIGNTSNTPWQIADITSYANIYSGGKNGLTEEKQQEVLNYIITQAAETKSAGDLAKYIIALKAMGYDARKVETVNTPAGSYFDMVSELKKMVKNGDADSIYTLPYVLIALQQDDSYATKSEINSIVKKILKQELSNGGWGYTTEEGSSKTEAIDIDATAPVILALSEYYDTNSDVKTALDKVISTEFIGAYQGKTGAIYSTWTNAASAETTGLVLTGLAACGKDYTDYKVDGKTLVDGLMNLLNKDKDGFLYNGSESDMSTEQGFRGLLAAMQAKKTGKAYNIYDFSSNSANVAKATGKGSTDTPAEPTGDTDIKVYLTVKTDTETWLERAEVKVKSDASVYHAFVKGITDAGMSQDGAANGYVKSITKSGTTLGEFDKGQNSGWLYKVNGVLPNVPLTSYKLSDGDEILWYYTVDYKKDPSASKWDEETKEVTTTEAAGAATTTSPADVKVTEQTSTDGTKKKVAEVTVSSANQKEILSQAKTNKSTEIVLNVSSDSAKDASKVDVKLDKSFVNSIVSDTDAKLTIKTPLGDKTYTEDELKTLAAAATGTTVTLTIEKADSQVDTEDELDVKAEVAKFTPVARSSKTAKKNIKVTTSLDKNDKAIIAELKDAGYTVKYRFYRSTKKASGYKAMLTGTTGKYTNTVGKKGTRYYYKVQLRVYNQTGKLVAKTALKQCKYATRKF